jgi:hypothetical protein
MRMVESALLAFRPQILVRNTPVVVGAEPTQQTKRLYYLWHRAREVLQERFGDDHVALCRKPLTIYTLYMGITGGKPVRAIIVKVDRRSGELVWSQAGADNMRSDLGSLKEEVQARIN